MFKFYQPLPPIPTRHAATCCDSQREAALPSPGLKASAPPFWPQLTAADRSQWLCATPCHSVPLCAALTVLFSRARRISCGLSMTFDDFRWLLMTFDTEKTWKNLGLGDLLGRRRWQRTHFWKAPRLRGSAVIAVSELCQMLSGSRPQALRLVRKCPAERSRRAEKMRLDKAMKIGIQNWILKDWMTHKRWWTPELAERPQTSTKCIIIWQSDILNEEIQKQRLSSAIIGLIGHGAVVPVVPNRRWDRNVVAPGGFWPVGWGRWHKRSGSPGSPGSLGAFVDFRGVSAPTVPLDHVARNARSFRGWTGRHSTQKELGVQGIPHHPTFLLCSLPQKWNF